MCERSHLARKAQERKEMEERVATAVEQIRRFYALEAIRNATREELIAENRNPEVVRLLRASQ
jgi:hypothetical protein